MRAPQGPSQHQRSQRWVLAVCSTAVGVAVWLGISFMVFESMVWLAPRDPAGPYCFWFVLTPLLMLCGSLVTGILMPSPGLHPSRDAALCTPATWVLVAAAFIVAPEGPADLAWVAPVFVVVLVLGWGATFVGHTIWSRAERREAAAESSEGNGHAA